MQLLLLNTLLAITIGSRVAYATGKQGQYQRIFLYYAHWLDTVASKALKMDRAIAPGCIGAAGGPCTFNEFLKYIVDPANRLRPRKGTTETFRPFPSDINVIQNPDTAVDWMLQKAFYRATGDNLNRLIPGCAPEALVEQDANHLTAMWEAVMDRLKKIYGDPRVKEGNMYTLQKRAMADIARKIYIRRRESHRFDLSTYFAGTIFSPEGKDAPSTFKPVFVNRKLDDGKEYPIFDIEATLQQYNYRDDRRRVLQIYRKYNERKGTGPHLAMLKITEKLIEGLACRDFFKDKGTT